MKLFAHIFAIKDLKDVHLTQPEMDAYDKDIISHVFCKACTILKPYLFKSVSNSAFTEMEYAMK